MRYLVCLFFFTSDPGQVHGQILDKSYFNSNWFDESDLYYFNPAKIRDLDISNVSVYEEKDTMPSIS
ncbi:MAG TPA: hypothetical protein VI731_05605, partial [Bacteroidia bacterium]|nr:hypothetical protein [Bacteroidia bacterium]